MANIMIVLMRTSQLLGARNNATDQVEPSSEAQSSDDHSFLENFLPHGTCPHSDGFHLKFVNLFVSRVRASKLEEAMPHLKNYLKYFIKCRKYNQFQLPGFFEILFDAKKSLEFWVEATAKDLRFVQHIVCWYMKALERKIEPMGAMEIGVEDRGRCVPGSETFDVLLNQLRAGSCCRRGS